MKRYARLLLDFMFKKCFGTEANKPLLISLLNAFLEKRLEAPIVDLRYLPTVTVGKTSLSRGTVFDLSCEDALGNRFLIEVQAEPQKYFADRAFFYRSRVQSEMASRGEEWDYRLPRLHVLSFLDFKLDDDPGYSREIMYMDTCKHTIFSDRECFTFVEVPKFTKSVEECVNLQELWIYLLANLHKLDSRPPQFKETIFETLFEIAEIAKFEPKELDLYRKSMEFYDDTERCIRYATEKAAEKGLAEGLAKGLEQGLAQGVAQGKSELIGTMLKSGADWSTITRLTGIHPEDFPAKNAE